MISPDIYELMEEELAEAIEKKTKNPSGISSRFSSSQ